MLKYHLLFASSICLMLLGSGCGHKTRQVAGSGEPIRDFKIEAQPRQFENAPPNTTVVKLQFIGDSVSLVEQKPGVAALSQYDPAQTDPDVLKGIISVYRYEVLNAAGLAILTGYFPVDDRMQSFYPGSGSQKDQVLHETSTAPSTLVTLCLPLDSLNAYQEIRIRKIIYENGKPVPEDQLEKQSNRTPIIQLPLKRQ
jgi:hypothetical protein